jgi:transglutaminase-like putative cysteine protease
VSCVLTFNVTTPAGVAIQAALARRPGVRTSEQLTVTNNGVALSTHEIVDPDGGRQHVIDAQPGNLTVTYRATVTRTGDVVAEAVTDAARVAALRPSRYCPSDRMAGFARSHFGDLPTALARTQAICAYVWRHIGYTSSASGSSTDAVDTLLAGRGVCRDFAHLVATLCRAVDVPARIASVYAPGLSPMDFHAVVETAVDGHWWVWDSTRLAPRPALMRIATGRDAADTAFATVLSGLAEFATVEVGAVAARDLPADDHEAPVPLG